MAGDFLFSKILVSALKLLFLYSECYKHENLYTFCTTVDTAYSLGMPCVRFPFANSEFSYDMLTCYNCHSRSVSDVLNQLYTCVLNMNVQWYIDIDRQLEHRSINNILSTIIYERTLIQYSNSPKRNKVVRFPRFGGSNRIHISAYFICESTTVSYINTTL